MQRGLRQEKKLGRGAQGPEIRGLRRNQLPTDIVGLTVDKVGKTLQRPRAIWSHEGWSFFVQKAARLSTGLPGTAFDGHAACLV
jgi:hypothetical protein